MSYSKKTGIGCLILGAVLILALVPIKDDLHAYHSPEELINYHALLSIAELDTSHYFATASRCDGCHGFDFEGYALVDGEGTDVNMYDDWAPTMMANSAKDPFWRAKVSHEVLVNPQHKADLETVCTSCHAPMGHYTALFKGHEHYFMDSLMVDTIGLDGVSCAACHQQSPENLGAEFTGKLNFDTSFVLYGPYPMPFAPPMQDFVGFVPEYSEHINDADLCASCHTLIVNSVDLDGNPTGTTYVEQATYHEWLNSKYNEDSVSCQGCHMPRIEDPVVISDNYIFLQPRSPYGLHDLVGANTFMLKLMQENKEALGITATDDSYEETIQKTFAMLQQQSLDLNLEMMNADMDSAYFRVTVTNKAGHKFPSGYPSRRAFIEFTVTTEDDTYLFTSGLLDDNYEVEGHDAFFEPHYQMINQSDQVQIYELVNGDVNGDFSTVLERGYAALKDNRLPPLGFTTTHETYDTVQIVGTALNDADFNRDNSGEEGTGADQIYYHVPLQNYSGIINIRARVYYQSLPPKWMEEMFGESTPEIEAFREMYNSADQSAVLVGEAILEDVYVESVNTQELAVVELQLFPNPSNGQVQLPNLERPITQWTIFDSQGRVVRSGNSQATSLQLPEAPGLYWIQLHTGAQRYQGKVVRQ